MPPEPLEDEAADILGKACRGRQMDARSLSDASGLPVSVAEAALDGELPEGDALAALCRALGLDPDRLAAIAGGRWRPEAAPPEGLVRLTSEWHDMLVHCYLCFDPASREAILFDTGVDLGAVTEAVRARGLNLRAVCITHTHPDHVACVPELPRVFPGVPVHRPAGEPLDDTLAARAGDRWSVGALGVLALSTPGHSPDALSYRVSGLAAPVLVAGDCLFAGSIGGPNVSLPLALRTIRENVFTLPPETVICPGHGPLTTVADELAHNPFFPHAGQAAEPAATGAHR